MMTTKKALKSAFESMLFVIGEPLDVKTAADAVGINKKEASEIFRELKDEYEDAERGIRIKEAGDTFQFVSHEENFEYIKAICTPVRERRLSRAALEALAIVAYKQPVTRSEIDSIRGIKSDRVLEGLIAKELIEERGRSSAIGRPTLYGTTVRFLSYFDMKDLGELPQLDDEELEEAIMNFSDPEPESALEVGQTKLELL